MNKKLLAFAAVIMTLTACQKGMVSMEDRTHLPCGDKPNCVSTEDKRKAFNIASFELAPNTTLDQIEKVALRLPGAKLAAKKQDYLHIECTTRIMRFVDDLELKLQGDTLIVRSESRVGYSDFGVNRKRAEQLRQLLKQAKLLG